MINNLIHYTFKNNLSVLAMEQYDNVSDVDTLYSVNEDEIDIGKDMLNIFQTVFGRTYKHSKFFKSQFEEMGSTQKTYNVEATEVFVKKHIKRNIPEALKLGAFCHNYIDKITQCLEKIKQDKIDYFQQQNYLLEKEIIELAKSMATIKNTILKEQMNQILLLFKTQYDQHLEKNTSPILHINSSLEPFFRISLYCNTGNSCKFQQLFLGYEENYIKTLKTINIQLIQAFQDLLTYFKNNEYLQSKLTNSYDIIKNITEMFLKTFRDLSNIIDYEKNNIAYIIEFRKEIKDLLVNRRTMNKEIMELKCHEYFQHLLTGLAGCDKTKKTNNILVNSALNKAFIYSIEQYFKNQKNYQNNFVKEQSEQYEDIIKKLKIIDDLDMQDIFFRGILKETIEFVENDCLAYLLNIYIPQQENDNTEELILSLCRNTENDTCATNLEYIKHNIITLISKHNRIHSTAQNVLDNIKKEWDLEKIQDMAKQSIEEFPDKKDEILQAQNKQEYYNIVYDHLIKILDRQKNILLERNQALQYFLSFQEKKHLLLKEEKSLQDQWKKQNSQRLKSFFQDQCETTIQDDENNIFKKNTTIKYLICGIRENINSQKNIPDQYYINEIKKFLQDKKYYQSHCFITACQTFETSIEKLQNMIKDIDQESFKNLVNDTIEHLQGFHKTYLDENKAMQEQNEKIKEIFENALITDYITYDIDSSTLFINKLTTHSYKFRKLESEIGNKIKYFRNSIKVYENQEFEKTNPNVGKRYFSILKDLINIYNAQNNIVLSRANIVEVILPEFIATQYESLKKVKLSQEQLNLNNKYTNYLEKLAPFFCKNTTEHCKDNTLYKTSTSYNVIDAIRKRLKYENFYPKNDFIEQDEEINGTITFLRKVIDTYSEEESHKKIYTYLLKQLEILENLHNSMLDTVKEFQEKSQNIQELFENALQTENIYCYLYFDNFYERINKYFHKLQNKYKENKEILDQYKEDEQIYNKYMRQEGIDILGNIESKLSTIQNTILKQEKIVEHIVNFREKIKNLLLNPQELNRDESMKKCQKLLESFIISIDCL